MENGSGGVVLLVSLNQSATSGEQPLGLGSDLETRLYKSPDVNCEMCLDIGGATPEALTVLTGCCEGRGWLNSRTGSRREYPSKCRGDKGAAHEETQSNRVCAFEIAQSTSEN